VAELWLLIVSITAIMQARRMQTGLVSTTALETCISSDSMEQRTKRIVRKSMIANALYPATLSKEGHESIQENQRCRIKYNYLSAVFFPLTSSTA
jgi:hypothetical protein